MRTLIAALTVAMLAVSAHADRLNLTTNTLVGVNEAGEEVAKLTFLQDGRVSIKLLGKAEKTVEPKAIGAGEEGGFSWDLGDELELEMNPGVSAFGSYKDRVNRFLLFNGIEMILLRADVSINK